MDDRVLDYLRAGRLLRLFPAGHDSLAGMQSAGKSGLLLAGIMQEVPVIYTGLGLVWSAQMIPKSTNALID
jgi:hypothetical protein